MTFKTTTALYIIIPICSSVTLVYLPNEISSSCSTNLGCCMSSVLDLIMVLAFVWGMSIGISDSSSLSLIEQK